jgi:hypothetical protein
MLAVGLAGVASRDESRRRNLLREAGEAEGQPSRASQLPFSELRTPNGTAMAAFSGMLLSEPAVGEHFVNPWPLV